MSAISKVLSKLISKKSSSKSSSSGYRTRSRKSSKRSKKPNNNADPGPLKYFPKPELMIYRFLYVIKSRTELILEILKFVEKNLNSFLKTNWNEPEMVDLIQDLRMESIQNCIDENGNSDPPTVFAETQPVVAIQDSVIMYVIWKCYKARSELDIGHETVALKRLIHLVCIDGIITRQFNIQIDKKHVKALRYCKQKGVKQYLMSNAVRPLWQNNRLISYTDSGDLTKYFHSFIDDNISKREKETYVELAAKFNLPPSSILLVAFSKTECKKAARAGFMVAKIKECNQKKPKYYTIRIISDMSNIRFAPPVVVTPTKHLNTKMMVTPKIKSADKRRFNDTVSSGSRESRLTNSRNRSKSGSAKQKNKNKKKVISSSTTTSTATSSSSSNIKSKSKNKSKSGSNKKKQSQSSSKKKSKTK